VKHTEQSSLEIRNDCSNKKETCSYLGKFYFKEKLPPNSKGSKEIIGMVKEVHTTFNMLKLSTLEVKQEDDLWWFWRPKINIMWVHVNCEASTQFVTVTGWSKLFFSRLSFKKIKKSKYINVWKWIVKLALFFCSYVYSLNWMQRSQKKLMEIEKKKR
jgi:hypothetical protein